jgi:hypothetical protein
VFGSNDYTCEIETPDNHFPQFSRFAFRRSDSLKYVVGMAREENTRLSQIRPPSDTAKKRHPKFDLQLMDLMRDIRLAHVELLRGPGKAREPSDRFEYSEPCHGHGGRRIRALRTCVLPHSNAWLSLWSACKVYITRVIEMWLLHVSSAWGCAPLGPDLKGLLEPVGRPQQT